MAKRSEKMQQVRHEKLEKFLAQGIDPFPAEVKRTHTANQAAKKTDQNVVVVGRLNTWRGHGKLQFADVIDETGKIQLAFKADKLTPTQFENLPLLDPGDFIEATGKTFLTKTGEMTVEVANWRILSKALRPIPTKWQGIKDKEIRFRKRYLDMILHPEVKSLLDKRWAIEKAIREFLWRENYQEVETPVLQSLYGGTNARPFTTHLNALDIEMYLRVAPELYLKRLVVGGYERVFEIARNFRNEGMDQTHQPEFTMMEFYEAYADYIRIMDLTEELIKYVAQAVNGSLKLEVEGFEVDLSGKWERITIDEALLKYEGIDWETITDEEIKQILKEHKFKVPGVFSRDKALFTIFDHLVPPKLINPTWVIDYPIEVSPLSRAHREKRGRVERFEGYIGGKEICDGWSEIISPLEQRSRFENEQKNLKAGDDEAQPLDEDFLTALSYGMPPLGGIGIGIDRLVMFLTNTWSIREVVAFPLMRPKENEAELPVINTDNRQEFSIDSAVTEKFPDMAFAYTIISGVKVKQEVKELEELKTLVAKKYRVEVAEVAGLAEIKAYRNVFKNTGVWGQGRRPSVEALLRRLGKEGGLPKINSVVDGINAAAIKHRVALSGFDAGAVSLPISLRLSQKGEEVSLLGKEGKVKTQAGELVYADRRGVLTLDLNWRDAERVKIGQDTKEVILIADGAPGITDKQLVDALEQTAENIRRYSGGKMESITIVKGQE